MKKTGIVMTIILMLAALLSTPHADASTDGYYQLSEVTASWDGTNTRLSTPITAMPTRQR